MNAPARTLLALGRFRREQRLALSSAAGAAAYDVEFHESGREASRWLDSNAPQVVALDDDPGSRGLCLEARAQARFAHTPMISLISELDDLSFAEVFSWGGDDAILARDGQALVARLRALPTAPLPPPHDVRGLALVVEPDRVRRIVLGRVLRNAGFGVGFAGTAEDALERLSERPHALVVANAEVGASPESMLAAARAAGQDATWIAICAPRDLRAVRGVVESFGNAAVTDGFAPPENVVFLANELSRGGASDKRVSRRLLFGTTVLFRGAGREADACGYLYNVSEGGLYVRTLAPPEDDVVWLELLPPRSDRRVRLEGRVVWRRRFGPSEGATVPPGFGVALHDG
ncbi:MAG: PilZ domain-containing protein, partial [Deltaproteobacteria bacterium]|nr:PilZ domain-containing protein [Deltaproteobacteria bacterium]